MKMELGMYFKKCCQLEFPEANNENGSRTVL